MAIVKIVNAIFSVSMCHFQETTSLAIFDTRLDTVYCLTRTNGYDFHNNKIESHPSAVIFLAFTRGAVNVCYILQYDVTFSLHLMHTCIIVIEFDSPR